MAKVERNIEATTNRVWSVLADGRHYADWVVGAAKIRKVSSNWPAVGSSLHHTVGVLPIHIRDSTTVLVSRKNEYLELRGRVRPLGKAKISFSLEGVGMSTKVTMSEIIDKGIAAKFYGRLMKASIRARNEETLRRLDNQVTSAT